jgi:myo-inositol-1(or 4)-monophosphatase
MEEFVTTCEEAARLGGGILLDWRDRFAVREKGPADLVTEADLASQEAIRGLIAQRFPEHAFLGEENPDFSVLDSPFCWIVDPLDGTTNYVHGLPNYAVSVAVARGGVVLAGAVYDPVGEESFTVVVGQGAFCNGVRLAASGIAELSRALVAVSFPTRISRESPDIAALLAILPHCQAFRRMGSSALNLCYLAAGRLDAYWSTSTKIWDIAAGILMVQEAGGRVSGPTGKRFDLASGDFLAAATPRLHQVVVDILGETFRRRNASNDRSAGLD